MTLYRLLPAPLDLKKLSSPLKYVFTFFSGSKKWNDESYGQFLYRMGHRYCCGCFYMLFWVWIVWRSLSVSFYINIAALKCFERDPFEFAMTAIFKGDSVEETLINVKFSIYVHCTVLHIFTQFGLFMM